MPKTKVQLEIDNVQSDNDRMEQNSLIRFECQLKEEVVQ